jgi:monofunctional biosynthetic peptidoglycan transglycosylase
VAKRKASAKQKPLKKQQSSPRPFALIKMVLAAILLFLVIDIGRYAVYPNIGRLVDENPTKTAFMEYREAEWQREGFSDKRIRQRWVPLKQVSPNLIKAVLIAEDDKFWKHEGFDYKAMEHALEKNIRTKKISMGGSTISQQLAKNLFLSPSKNPIRKIKEAILTWRMENTLSKRRILELYVNVAEWGDGIFGIAEASRHYYGVAPSQLSARQASRLAAVLPNPIRYSPIGSARYVRNRSNIIHAIMVRRGIVLPDYNEVMELPMDSTAVDSVNIGIPFNLLEQAINADSALSATPSVPATEEVKQEEKSEVGASVEGNGKGVGAP